MRIYLSGPITGTKDYMERFAAAESELSEFDLAVVNPAKVNGQLPKETTYSEYMEMSMAMLKQCDAIYMLKGWTDSPGAMAEFEYAYEHGIAILFEGGALAWLTRRQDAANLASSPA